MKKKLILVICAVLLLSACSRDIPAEYLNRAADPCSKPGGLKMLRIDTVRDGGREIVEAVCNDEVTYSTDLIVNGQ